jgi:hypothetical protein
MATPTSLPASFVTGNVLTAAQMNDLRGAFRILQVVQGTTTTGASSSTTTYADTNLTATITPSSTSSKILVIASQQGLRKTNANANNALRLRLMRGATAIHNIANANLFSGTALEMRGSCTAVYLDSPATTSATTYKTQFANDSATAAVEVQSGGTSTESTIILCEVSA